MNREFRKQSLNKLIKQAGIVTDMVEDHFGKKPVAFQALGSVGPGTTVLMPANPIKPDGTVDIVIQIRGIAGGDTKSAANTGMNAVIVTAEAGGIGSKENFSAFGNANFVNKAVNTVLSSLKKQFPEKPITLGRLVVSSFSGGGSATANLLANRDKLPQGKLPPKFVFIDGLHIDPNSKTMNAIVDFGKKAKEDPKMGELEIVHTAVIPSGYASTTETANHILNSLGLQKTKVTNWNGKGRSPAAEAKAGGVRIVQLYDTPEPYMAKDPNTGEVRPNVPGTAGWQHIQALQWGLENALRPKT